MCTRIIMFSALVRTFSMMGMCTWQIAFVAATLATTFFPATFFPATILAQSDISLTSVFSVERQVSGQPGKIIDSNSLPVFPDVPSYNFGGSTVTAGRRIQFSSAFSNAGPNTANNLRVRFLLPVASALLEGTLNPSISGGGVPGRCTVEDMIDSRTVIMCRYGDVAIGGSAQARFQALIDPNLASGTQLSIDSFAESETNDPNDSNNVTGIQFDARPYSDVLIERLVSPALVNAGEIVNYRIVLTNRGPSMAHNVFVIDEISGGEELLSIVGSNVLGSSGFCYFANLETPSLNCSLGNIPPGRVITIDAQVLVDPLASSSVILNDLVTVTGQSELVVTGDSAGAVSVGEESDLSVHTFPSSLSIPAGQEVHYSLRALNAGPSVARDVQVTHVLPPGVSYAADSIGCIESPAGTLTCNVGDLSPGGTVFFDILGILSCESAIGTRLTSTSSVTSGNSIDPATNNNTAISNAVSDLALACATPTPEAVATAQPKPLPTTMPTPGLTSSFIPVSPTVAVKGSKAIVSFSEISGASAYEITLTSRRGKTITREVSSTSVNFARLSPGPYIVALRAIFVDAAGNTGKTQSSAPTSFVVKRKKKR